MSSLFQMPLKLPRVAGGARAARLAWWGWVNPGQRSRCGPPGVGIRRISGFLGISIGLHLDDHQFYGNEPAPANTAANSASSKYVRARSNVRVQPCLPVR